MCGWLKSLQRPVNSMAEGRSECRQRCLQTGIGDHRCGRFGAETLGSPTTLNGAVVSRYSWSR